jgi:hypothetical protein
MFYEDGLAGGPHKLLSRFKVLTNFILTWGTGQEKELRSECRGCREVEENEVIRNLGIRAIFDSCVRGCGLGWG